MEKTLQSRVHELITQLLDTSLSKSNPQWANWARHTLDGEDTRLEAYRLWCSFEESVGEVNLLGAVSHDAIQVAECRQSDPAKSIVAADVTVTEFWFRYYQITGTQIPPDVWANVPYVEGEWGPVYIGFTMEEVKEFCLCHGSVFSYLEVHAGGEYVTAYRFGVEQLVDENYE